VISALRGRLGIWASVPSERHSPPREPTRHTDLRSCRIARPGDTQQFFNPARIAYAPDLGELAQRIANDAHQIFNGSIPFYQPNKFQLIVNARSARELGLPAILIARADEVIE
jgi:hypothetical protein